MRFCLHCDHTFIANGWSCSACGWSPQCVDGFLCFAPDLAHQNSDYDSSYFRLLVKLEDNNFWFQARNRLILWAISHFFGDAQSILEIGVGTGFVTRALRASLPEANIWGSDIHIEGLRFADERLKGTVNLFQMDAVRIPFRAEFDVVGLFDVLEHIEDDVAVLNEIARALKPRGGLLLAVPQHMALWGPADDAAFHKRRYGAQELVRKVKNAGFEVILKTSFVSLLLPLLYLARLRSRWTRKYNIVDELNIHPALNALFGGLLSLERKAICSGVRFPAGGSQFLIARKAA